MASAIFNIARTNFANSSVSYLNDDIKVALTYGYIPDVDNDISYEDVIGNEVVGVGYDSGGSSLTTKTVVQDNANDRTYFKADDMHWENTTLTANGAVVYKVGSSNIDSPLIAYIDFTTVFSTQGQNFIIKWDTIQGVFHLR